MTTPGEMISRLAADLHTRGEQRRHTLSRLASASATVTSPMNELTVTVGAQGAIEELRFNNRDYRDQSAEVVSKLVLDTIRKAGEKWRAQAADALRDGPVPALAGMLDGSGDWSDLLPLSALDEVSGPRPERSTR